MGRTSIGLISFTLVILARKEWDDMALGLILYRFVKGIFERIKMMQMTEFKTSEYTE